MICPICHKKVNRINSCRILVARGTARRKSERTCQSCAIQLLKLVCDGLLDKSSIDLTDISILHLETSPKGE